MKDEIVEYLAYEGNVPKTQHEVCSTLASSNEQYELYKAAFNTLVAMRRLVPHDAILWKLPTVYVCYISGKLVAIKHNRDEAERYLVERHGDISQHTTHYSDDENVYIYNSGLVISILEMVIT